MIINIDIPVVPCDCSIGSLNFDEMIAFAKRIWEKPFKSYFYFKADYPVYFQMHINFIKVSLPKFNPATDNVIELTKERIIDSETGISLSGQVTGYQFMNLYIKNVTQDEVNRTFTHEVGHLVFHGDAYDKFAFPMRPISAWPLADLPNIMYDAAPITHWENFREIFNDEPSGILLEWIHRAERTFKLDYKSP